MLRQFCKQLFVRLTSLVVISCSVLWCQTDSARNLSLGSDSIHTTEDMCLMVGAWAVGGDFFKGLRTHKNGERRTFKRHGEVVEFFPEQLIVKVEAAVAPCVGKSKLACDRCDFRFDSEFMKSLQFDAFWKRGFEERKADIGVLSEEESNDLAMIAPTANLWNPPRQAF